MAGTLVSWAIIVIIWGQRCRANTQFLFLCALTQTDGCLATSQELIIDPFAKSSFLCWFFHLPPSEYKAIRLDVGDPGDTPDVRWLAVVIMGGAVVTMVRRLHMSPLHLPVLAEVCKTAPRFRSLCAHCGAQQRHQHQHQHHYTFIGGTNCPLLPSYHPSPARARHRGGIWQINFKTCIYNFSPLKDGSFVM